MSPVEHDYPPREVHRPKTDRHAAKHSYIEALPSAAAGRVHIYTTNTPSHSRASSDSFHSNTYAAMDDQVMIPTKPSQHGGPQSEEQAPVLPQKSALRASRLLDNLVGLKLTMPDPPSFTQTPHDEYMSSEEDASSTAGDFSDFEYDSSSDDVCPSPAKERRSHEVTARVVSVIFSGKPSVVDVPQNRRSISPTSFEARQSIMDLATQSPARDSEVEVKRRRMSVVSTSSDSVSIKPARISHPPRSSSMQPPATHNTIKKTKPAFLQIDPYANGSVYSLDVLQEPKEAEQEDDRPKTPRTPTKMFKGVARTLSLMKRRSTPRMNQAFLSTSQEHVPLAISPSKRSILGEPLCEAPQEMGHEEAIEETAELAVPPPPQRPPPQPISTAVTYDEIVRVAKRNERMERNEKLLSVARTPTSDLAESPISPMSPLSATSTNTTATTGKRMSSFNAARRRMSIKLTGKLQL